ncbi:Signal transduction response regulator receiver domain [Arabidopsis thaliana x Arabidopsis arenosa]|uniref:Two-component response regulator n=1 Tax=Arabidopsis thaliana x Arabidopsis arenosa TaxID=1240361 RepID=A0A8T2GNL0_9BRAS|nr:Signal transduction response regulator receiver domain [Arabidopsis thaliana x Arabidopsis arenosa]
MLVGKISGYEDNTRSLERETSEITSLLSQFPGNTNVLVVDTNFTTLLNMKQIMKQYAYQVSIETDAEKALAFLTSCKHEINIVIWDFHMPGIDGLQALKSITSKLDLPVVIMSDDNQTESVMKATFYGACDYVVKPVKEEVMANIWQHIVRKRLIFKPDVAPPVQSDPARSDRLDQVKADFKIVEDEPIINETPLITWTEEIQPVQSDLVQANKFDQVNGYSPIMNQDNMFNKAPPKPRMTWTEVIQPVQSNLVQTKEFGQVNDYSQIMNQDSMYNKAATKPQLTWTEEIQPVQSGLVQANEFSKVNGYSQIMNQDSMFNKSATNQRLTWNEVLQPVQSDLVQSNEFSQFSDYSQIMNEDNMFNKAAKKPRMTWSKVFQPVQSHLVPTDGLDRDHFDSITINGGNGIQNMEKKQGKKPRKPRMTWTEELHQKFLEAIEIIGGIEKANPKVLVECLQEMRIEGITRSNVASHLQKHRINLEENQIPQQTQGNGWATAYGTLATSLQGSDNVNTTIPSYLMNGPATLNQIQQNQYQNGFLTMNNNQIITNPPPPLPYLDHHHQQQHQSSPQFNYLMNNEELLQASGLSATDLELTYPSLPYDPQEYLINGYNYN